MGTLFMPDNFVVAKLSIGEIKITSIAWGFQLGFTLLTAVKAAIQTIRIWRRTGRITGYVLMVWLERLVNTIFGVLSWLCMNGTIPSSFAFFMTAVTLWCVELHLLIQIIVNRVSLLIVSRRRAAIVKWGSCAIILFINIGVYCVWVPARLQISETYIKVNDIFDRCEKALYLILDATLNFYFCYLVKTKLIKTGMTKYTSLYKFNMSIVFVSLSMDILLIGMMSMKNQLIYVQFHPLCFMVKLNIELNMADMISKVASAPGQAMSYSYDRRYNADSGMSGVNGKGDGPGLLQHRRPARTMVVANGNIFTGRENQGDRTVSDALDEASTNRRYTNGDQLYHAWVSGGTASPVHNARGRPTQWLDERDSGDVEARIRVVGRSGDTMDNLNVITKNTTVRVTWESVTDTESSTESLTAAPSEADSMKTLREDSS